MMILLTTWKQMNLLTNAVKLQTCYNKVINQGSRSCVKLIADRMFLNHLQLYCDSELYLFCWLFPGYVFFFYLYVCLSSFLLCMYVCVCCCFFVLFVSFLGVKHLNKFERVSIMESHFPLLVLMLYISCFCFYKVRY